MFFDLKNMLKYFFNFLFYNFVFKNLFLFFAKLEKVKIKIQHVFKVKKHVGKNKLFYKTCCFNFIKNFIKHVVLILLKLF